MTRIGLVAEGSHDYFMIEPLLKMELMARGHNNVSFDRLQPVQDATGYFPDGGWTRVLAWCLANAGNDFDSVLIGPVANIPDLDAILVHLDGDTAEKVGAYTNIGRPHPLTAQRRVGYLSAVVEDWLQLSVQQRPKLIIAVPVQHTEAWMNASLNSVNGPWESGDAKASFRARRNAATHPTMADYYEHGGLAAAGRIPLIDQRCASYRLFLDEIDKSVL